MDKEALYQVYFSLGPERTIAKVAELTGKNANALYQISSKNNWRNRALKETYQDNIKSEDMDVSNPEAVISEIANKSLIKLSQTVDTIRPTNARDAKALLEIYLLLSNRATVITQENQKLTEEQAQVYFERAFESVYNVLTPEQKEKVLEQFQEDYAQEQRASA